MSYDISFKVKVEGADIYVPVGNCEANTTWNVRKMIVESTGLEWKNEENNGLCVDVIPKIKHGYEELCNHPEKYRQYNSPNGWGTVETTKGFFKCILDAWEYIVRWHEELLPYATFWIE